MDCIYRRGRVSVFLPFSILLVAPDESTSRSALARPISVPLMLLLLYFFFCLVVIFLFCLADVRPVTIVVRAGKLGKLNDPRGPRGTGDGEKLQKVGPLSRRTRDEHRFVNATEPINPAADDLTTRTIRTFYSLARLARFALALAGISVTMDRDKRGRKKNRGVSWHRREGLTMLRLEVSSPTIL